MHGVMESRDNPEAMAAHHDADLVVWDGMPLVWLGRLYGFAAMRRRVYGPEFMAQNSCGHSAPGQPTNLRIFPRRITGDTGALADDIRAGVLA